MSSIVRISRLGKANPSTNLELKTVRAKHHLDEIYSEFRSAFEPEPYLISRQDYSRKQKHVIRIQSKPLPIDIPLLIGDFVNCLRSGLDQLAWSLARLHTACPRRQTCFPISSDGKFNADQIRDILPTAMPLIKELQPYQRGNRFETHPLWILNRLVTIDKHRTLAMKASEMKVRVIGISPDEWTFKHLDFGAEIATDIRNRNKVQLDPYPPSLIVGEPVPNCYGNFEINIFDLPSIYEFVRDEVAPKFRSFKK